jgi:hypothetical protein
MVPPLLSLPHGHKSAGYPNLGLHKRLPLRRTFGQQAAESILFSTARMSAIETRAPMSRPGAARGRRYSGSGCRPKRAG